MGFGLECLKKRIMSKKRKLFQKKEKRKKKKEKRKKKKEKRKKKKEKRKKKKENERRKKKLWFRFHLGLPFGVQKGFLSFECCKFKNKFKKS